MADTKQHHFRKTAIKEWSEHFVKEKKKEPTKKEYDIFATGFNAGWKGKMHRGARKYRADMQKFLKLIENLEFKELKKLINRELNMRRAKVS